MSADGATEGHPPGHADQPLAWSQKYDAGAWDFATGLGCDLWGHCTWVGTTTVDGTVTLIVSQRQP